jgi:DNA-binding CsgD family transcriptional regulator
MGLRHMMAVEIAEGAESDDVLAPVMGRERRAFTLAESRWLARIHWALKPVLMHLRERNGLLNWVKAQRHNVQDLLTAREQEVYHWMGLGKRNKEIAKIIGCAPRTVEKHIENILSKTSSETRTAATLGKLSPNRPAL